MVEPASLTFLEFPYEDAFYVNQLYGFVLVVPLNFLTFPEGFLLIDKSMSVASFFSLHMFWPIFSNCLLTSSGTFRIFCFRGKCLQSQEEKSFFMELQFRIE